MAPMIGPPPSLPAPRGSRRTLLTLLALLLVAAIPAAAEWPQFRGPDGLGVAGDEVSLPESWAPESPNVRWRTAIPGEGISSPVISNGRIFLTTAHEGAGSERLERSTLFGSLALAALFLGLAVARRRRVARAAGDAPPGAGRIERWDRRIVVGASLFFLVLALAVAARPDAFYEAGNPGRAWRMTGAVALIGLAAAFGWLDRRSRGRLLGVLVVLLAAVLFVQLSPSSPLGKSRLIKALPYLFFSLVIAAWYLVAFLRRGRAAGPGGPGAAPWIPLTLAALAALVFVPANFLSGLQRVVVCVDLASGEILWERSVLSGPAEQKWPNSTYATPTAVTDGEQVFAYFGHGLAAVDFEGRLLWRRMFPGYAHSTRYGAGSSPILTDRGVVVMREEESFQRNSPPSWIAAFDKRTGEPLWRIEPSGAHDSYTTPMLHRSGSRTLLLIASWNALVAYDAATGERLWSRDYPMEQMVASMAREGDTLAVTGGVYGDKSLIVLGVDGDGSETLWESTRSVAGIASPVFYRGMLFTVTTPGILSCYDATTGEVLWKKRLDGEYFASLVAGDGKVYAVNREGSTTVLTADRETEVIAENDLDEPVYATPAVAGDCLLLRTAGHLYCIESESARTTPVDAPS